MTIIFGNQCIVFSGTPTVKDAAFAVMMAELIKEHHAGNVT